MAFFRPDKVSDVHAITDNLADPEKLLAREP
jgi:hypothetical protein